jgi:hypothetical protein
MIKQLIPMYVGINVQCQMFHYWYEYSTYNGTKNITLLKPIVL